MKNKLRAICLFLTLAMPLQLCACAVPTAKASDLMEGIAANDAPAAPLSSEASAAAADFAVRLFKAANETDKNTLISPLSVLCALSMTANGAEGETLFQMESTLGMRRDLYNEFFKAYLAALSAGDGTALKLANSVWFKDTPGFTVKQAFLQTNADNYGAGAFKAPFDDGTRADINSWVSEHTDGMIPEILDRIPEDVVMYLVNALAFDAKWLRQYKDSEVIEGTFTCADGAERDADFMHSKETVYVEDELTTGFLKYYEGGRFAFVALLPKEGVGMDAYLGALTGERLQALLKGASSETVNAALPKFETEYDVELSEVLQSMGMELPFDRQNADFSGINEDPGVYINRVLHKTFLSVAEDGTRAGASTAVEMALKFAMPTEQPKQVFLNRPFVYLLLDCETNVPLFIGTMLDPT